MRIRGAADWTPRQRLQAQNLGAVAGATQPDAPRAPPSLTALFLAGFHALQLSPSSRSVPADFPVPVLSDMGLFRGFLGMHGICPSCLTKKASPAAPSPGRRAERLVRATARALALAITRSREDTCQGLCLTVWHEMGSQQGLRRSRGADNSGALFHRLVLWVASGEGLQLGVTMSIDSGTRAHPSFSLELLSPEQPS